MKLNNSKVDSHWLWRQSVLNNFNTHRFASAQYLPHDTFDIVVCQVIIYFLLKLCYFVDVFDTDTAGALVSRLLATLFQPRGLLDEISGGRGLDLEGETSIDISFQENTHRHILVELLCTCVELLAELHHVKS